MSDAGKFFFGAGLGCAGMVGLAFVALIVLAVVLPTDEPIPGKAMREDDLEALRELGILNEGEKIIYFYSPNVLDVSERGSFFSEDRVVAYAYADAEDTLEQATYQEIADVDVTYSEGWLEDTVVVVTREDDTEVLLVVANTDQGDRRFYNRLVKEWRKHVAAAVQAEATSESP
jgi:hypothetical protein